MLLGLSSFVWFLFGALVAAFATVVGARLFATTQADSGTGGSLSLNRASYRAAASRLPSASLDAVLRLARAGNKIAAIKEYRTLTGVGLKEAKDAVEALVPGGR